MSEQPQYVTDALGVAKAIDPSAETMGEGAWDCLLVDAGRADDVLAALPGSWEDPNDPVTAHTRIIVSDELTRS